MTFVHLHTHTEYSILDGASKISKLVERASQLGMPALAITDHGSLGGIYEFYRRCGEFGIQPILGSEFYQSPGVRSYRQPVWWGEYNQRQDDVGGGGKYCHLTVLAKGNDGAKNLFKLNADGFSSGFYGKARIDRESIASHSNGLIVLSGCAGSEISTRIKLGQIDEAYNTAKWFKEVFEEDFYLEVMYHANQIDSKINPVVVEMGRKLGIGVVLTNDSHFTAPEDKFAHEALCCLNTNRSLSDGSFFANSGDGFWLRSPEEMVRASEEAGLRREVVVRTLEIAEKIGDYSDIFNSTVKMPKAIIPEGVSATEQLWIQTMEGLYDEIEDPRYANQLHYELDTICALGFADYFLVKADIANEAKRMGIRTNTRGSAAGSLVAYGLGIHSIDPIKHRLVFERFINPQRASLPDIDFDIDGSRRSELISYITKRYGADHVAQIGTYGYIKAKRAIDDSAHLLGKQPSVAKALKKRMPAAQFGRSFDLDWKYFADLEDQDESLQDVDFGSSDRDVIDLATKLEGIIRFEGIHAAGVVISPQPIYELMPVRRPAGGETWVTAFHNTNADPQIEALGFVKYDYLGLRTLGVIDEVLRLLSLRQLSPPPLSSFDDPQTFKLLSRGDTLGVFQLDSPGMRGLLRKLKPTTLQDIIAVVALFRPGPMGVNAHTRYAERRHTVLHPELEESLSPILGETYGLIVYQEQVLEVLKTVCGWSYAEADLVFNAMRKKFRDKMEASKPAFYNAGESRGFSKEALSKLWDTLVPFADYSFNRAHATSYAIVAYQTAYLKANYTPQFMGVLLGSVANDSNRLPQYLRESERLGVPLEPPDINHSNSGFTVSDGSIKYGLSAIKGVGDAIIRTIIKNRPFTSLTDFLLRGPNNSGAVLALLSAGALDGLLGGLGGRRKAFGVIEQMVNAGAVIRQELSHGDQPLIPVQFENKIAAASHLEPLAAVFEKERAVLGVKLTVNPLKLKLLAPLNEEQWEVVRRILASSPGTTPVLAEYGGIEFEVGRCKLAPVVEKALSNLPIDIISDTSF